jgi:hypothetical protein
MLGRHLGGFAAVAGLHLFASGFAVVATTAFAYSGPRWLAGGLSGLCSLLWWPALLAERAGATLHPVLVPPANSVCWALVAYPLGVGAVRAWQAVAQHLSGRHS